MNDTIKAIECINTFQGEGEDTGRRMLIIRFKYCNLSCPYCDTIVKMRNSIESEYSIKDLQEFIDKNYTGLLITGGEPSIEKHFEDTVKLLRDLYYPVANVESNGFNLSELINSTKDFIKKECKTVNFMYSPKIFTKEDIVKEDEKTRIFRNYRNVFFKLVYEDNKLVNDYLKLLYSYNIHERVYLMPEGKTREELLKNAPKVFDACEKYKFNFSSREHIIYSFV